MKIYQIHSKQNLPISVDEAWQFLSNARNLGTITPNYMNFNIISGADRPVYAGQLIQYTVTPIANIKMQWVTEIISVKEGAYFVDEQKYGPYALWHHKHFIKEIPGGVEMEDIVDYKVPAGFLGRLAHPYLVKPKLEEIFEYRKKALEEKFGIYKNPEQTATTLKQDILA
ncbi:cell division inhibitor [Dokdonia sp. LLG6352-1]|uniref:SRPBCC family protein n=1 Tax=Dokdonia sp. LLG6352-1 TaxID=3160831 RepID=UPI003865116F